jgi:FkbM family methyltransferase
MARGPLREWLRLGWIRFDAASYWRYYVRKRGLAEPELALLPQLCSRDGTSVDVGANIGLYTCPLIEYSARCVAFEPLPPMARLLRRAYRRGDGRFRLEQVALSDRRGSAELRMPKGNFGYSTMEPANVLEGKVDTTRVLRFQVETRRLDDYTFEDVRFLKVDVEGHEESVLRGSRETLDRCHPAVLVEVEDRHNKGSVAAVLRLMGELGYEGYFLQDWQLHTADEFNLAEHQDPGAPERCVRNFLFLREGGRDALSDALEKLREDPPRVVGDRLRRQRALEQTVQRTNLGAGS